MRERSMSDLSREKKILFFFKDGCGPCAEKKPMVEEVAKELGVTIEFIDAPARRDLAQEYRVKAVPTVVLLDGEGKRIGSFMGGLINPGSLIKVLTR